MARLLPRILCLCLLVSMTSSCTSMLITSASAIFDRGYIENVLHDQTILAHAQESLDKDRQLREYGHVDVTVFKNQVLLVGQVPNQALKDHATALMKRIPYVERIYNQVQVKKTASIANMAKDSWITTKVKTKLLTAKDINPREIKVITEDGVVYLMGIVTRNSADLAALIARHTNGVRKVVKVFQYIKISYV